MTLQNNWKFRLEDLPAWYSTHPSSPHSQSPPIFASCCKSLLKLMSPSIVHSQLNHLIFLRCQACCQGDKTSKLGEDFFCFGPFSFYRLQVAGEENRFDAKLQWLAAFPQVKSTGLRFEKIWFLVDDCEIPPPS